MKEKSITPEGIINQAMGMNMSFTEAEFPVEIFPSMIQRIIHEVYECQSYPIDYTAASILTAIAAGIGNTHLVQMKQAGWRVPFCLLHWLADQVLTKAIPSVLP